MQATEGDLLLRAQDTNDLHVHTVVLLFLCDLVLGVGVIVDHAVKRGVDAGKDHACHRAQVFGQILGRKSMLCVDGVIRVEGKLLAEQLVVRELGLAKLVLVKRIARAVPHIGGIVNKVQKFGLGVVAELGKHNIGQLCFSRNNQHHLVLALGKLTRKHVVLREDIVGAVGRFGHQLAERGGIGSELCKLGLLDHRGIGRCQRGDRGVLHRAVKERALGVEGVRKIHAVVHLDGGVVILWHRKDVLCVLCGQIVVDLQIFHLIGGFGKVLNERIDVDVVR